MLGLSKRSSRSLAIAMLRDRVSTLWRHSEKYETLRQNCCLYARQVSGRSLFSPCLRYFTRSYGKTSYTYQIQTRLFACSQVLGRHIMIRYLPEYDGTICHDSRPTVVDDPCDPSFSWYLSSLTTITTNACLFEFCVCVAHRITNNRLSETDFHNKMTL